MRKKVDRKFISAGIPVSIYEKLEKVQEKIGLPTMVEALVFCIITTYGEKVENYKVRLAEPKEKLTPEERAERKIREEEIKREAERKVMHENGLRVCEALGGEVVEKNGFYACRFNTYEITNEFYASKGSMTIPFESLNEGYIVDQVRPEGRTREEAEAILANMVEQ